MYKRREFHYYGIPSPERAYARPRASCDVRGVDMTRDVSHATLTVALAGTSFSRLNLKTYNYELPI